MEYRLIQRDHPDPVVNDMGLSHRDPYFWTCWGQLLDRWTTHIVGRVADLTATDDRVVRLDELSQAVGLGQTIPQVQLHTVAQAMSVAERTGLGYPLRWSSPTQQGFCLHRNVRLLDEPQLRRLTDPALFAHADAVRAVNHRLARAGRTSVQLPDWLAERLGQSAPPIQANLTAGPATAAREGAFKAPRGPKPPGLSL